MNSEIQLEIKDEEKCLKDKLFLERNTCKVFKQEQTT